MNDVVKTKFDGHFVVRRNAIFERAKFSRRSQEEGESGDSFITSLYCLAEHCEYGVLKEEMILDRIVVRITDTNGWYFDSKKSYRHDSTKRGHQKGTIRFLRSNLATGGSSNVDFVQLTRCKVKGKTQESLTSTAKGSRKLHRGKMPILVSLSLGEMDQGDQPWLAKVDLEAVETIILTEVKFKLDTGAEETVISEEDYKTVG